MWLSLNSALTRAMPALLGLASNHIYFTLVFFAFVLARHNRVISVAIMTWWYNWCDLVSPSCAAKVSEKRGSSHII